MQKPPLQPQARSDDALRSRWSIRALLRKAADGLFSPYSLNRIYVIEPRRKALRQATRNFEIKPILAAEIVKDHPDPTISRKHSYAGAGAWGYGAWMEGTLVAVCWVWSDTRCGNSPIPLARNERALVDVHTQIEKRGLGIAPALIAFATEEAAREGCAKLVAWVWWTNKDSIRAFEKSGWVYDSFAFNLSLFGRKIGGRLPRNSLR